MNSTVAQLAELYSIESDELDVDLMGIEVSFDASLRATSRRQKVKALVADLQHTSTALCSQCERTIATTKFSSSVQAQLTRATWQQQQQLLRHGTFHVLARLDSSNLSSQGGSWSCLRHSSANTYEQGFSWNNL